MHPLDRGCTCLIDVPCPWSSQVSCRSLVCRVVCTCAGLSWVSRAASLPRTAPHTRRPAGGAHLHDKRRRGKRAASRVTARTSARLRPRLVSLDRFDRWLAPTRRFTGSGSLAGLDVHTCVQREHHCHRHGVFFCGCGVVPDDRFAADAVGRTALAKSASSRLAAAAAGRAAHNRSSIRSRGRIHRTGHADGVL